MSMEWPVLLGGNYTILLNVKDIVQRFGAARAWLIVAQPALIDGHACV